MDRTPATELPHLYYPAKRYHNRELYDVEANQKGQRGYYHTDMCTDEAIAFVKNNKPRLKAWVVWKNIRHVGPTACCRSLRRRSVFHSRQSWHWPPRIRPKIRGDRWHAANR